MKNNPEDDFKMAKKMNFGKRKRKLNVPDQDLENKGEYCDVYSRKANKTYLRTRLPMLQSRFES
jgi:hypothetical protein